MTKSYVLLEDHPGKGSQVLGVYASEAELLQASENTIGKDFQLYEDFQEAHGYSGLMCAEVASGQAPKQAKRRPIIWDKNEVKAHLKKASVYVIVERELGGDRQSDLYYRAFKSAKEALKTAENWATEIAENYESGGDFTAKVEVSEVYQQVTISDADDPDSIIEELSVKELDME